MLVIIMRTKCQIYGVDFSGAKKACKKIWICSGTIIEGNLQIEDCWCLKDKVKKGSNRNQCFEALKNLIATSKNAVFGIDFPFGLPYILLNKDDWVTFINKFQHQYNNPEQFHQTCFEAAGNKELKRRTDKESHSPFCVYNLRLFRQTYFGIHDVLYPLVRDNLACVMPMQALDVEKPLVLEICPASTLKQEGLYYRYKGKAGAKRQFREKILDGLIEKGLLNSISTNVREKIIEDTEGDALDSIVAAVATHRALHNNIDLSTSLHDAYKVEGYIYV